MAGPERLMPQLPTPLSDEEKGIINRARLIKNRILFGRRVRDSLQEGLGARDEFSKMAKRVFCVVLFELENLGIKPKRALRMIFPYSQSNVPKPIGDANSKAIIEEKIRQGQRIMSILKKPGLSEGLITIPVIDSKGNAGSVKISRTRVLEFAVNMIPDLIKEGFSEDRARKSLGLPTLKQPTSLK